MCISVNSFNILIFDFMICSRIFIWYTFDAHFVVQTFQECLLCIGLLFLNVNILLGPNLLVLSVNCSFHSRGSKVIFNSGSDSYPRAIYLGVQFTKHSNLMPNISLQIGIISQVLFNFIILSNKFSADLIPY